MGPVGLGRFVLPAAVSVALHAAAAAAILLLAGHGAPPAEAPSPIAVDLALAPPAAIAQPAPPPPQAVAAAVETPPVIPEPAPAAPPRRAPPRAVAHPVAAAPAEAVVAAAAPAPAMPAPGPAALGPSSAWVGALDAWIDSHLDYPEDSRRRGEQGAVLVRLTVAHDGRLLAFALLRGSGYDELDDATRAMFRNVRLPAAPLASDPPEATLSKPVRYVLR